MIIQSGIEVVVFGRDYDTDQHLGAVRLAFSTAGIQLLRADSQGQLLVV
jgi:hypothetical protein